MTVCGWLIAICIVGEAAFWGWIVGVGPDRAAIGAACAFFIVAALARLAVAVDRRLAQWPV